jgi:comEA protein
MRLIVIQLFQFLREKADRVILLSLCVGIVAMLFYLLIPQPQYTLQVKPLPSPVLNLQTNSGQAEAFSMAATASSFAASTEANTTPPKRSNAPKAKKPKQISLVNINTANAVLLDELPGVGPKMAQRILTYRRGVGRFQTIEELLGVKGIGPKKFAKMRPYLKL